jgi:hypothetical protein
LSDAPLPCAAAMPCAASVVPCGAEHEALLGREQKGRSPPDAAARARDEERLWRRNVRSCCELPCGHGEQAGGRGRGQDGPTRERLAHVWRFRSSPVGTPPVSHSDTHMHPRIRRRLGHLHAPTLSFRDAAGASRQRSERRKFAFSTRLDEEDRLAWRTRAPTASGRSTTS